MGISASSNKSENIALSYTNGDKFEGEIKNGIREGYGTYYYHNGDKYEGMWLKGKKHGMGTLYYKEGNLFVGQWKNSEKEGIGTLYLKNGEKYYGEFKAGKRNGKGILTSPDNNKYVGFFKHNKKHGVGLIHYNKGKIALEEWIDGVLISSKILTEQDLQNYKRDIAYAVEEDKKNISKLNNGNKNFDKDKNFPSNSNQAKIPFSTQNSKEIAHFNSNKTDSRKNAQSKFFDILYLKSLIFLI